MEIKQALTSEKLFKEFWIDRASHYRNISANKYNKIGTSSLKQQINSYIKTNYCDYLTPDEQEMYRTLFIKTIYGKEYEMFVAAGYKQTYDSCRCNGGTWHV